MDTLAAVPPIHRWTPSARLLAATPHRLLFFVGASNVLLAMAWWLLWLIDRRWSFGLPQPPMFAGWAHAFVMQYQVLPPFMFGFLLTVFPRWMSQPELGLKHYLPVGAGLLGGQLLFLTGLFGWPALVHLGVLSTLLGWGFGLLVLLRLLWRDGGKTWHAVSCALALWFGWVGVLLFALFLHRQNALLLFASIKFGSFGLLLPIFFTVAHRMFPFFANSVLPGYRPWRPLWLLVLFWPLSVAHLGLELAHTYGWLWLADLPLLLLSSVWLWRATMQKPLGKLPQAAAPWLLRCLFVGFAWLPLALVLYAAQSLWFGWSGQFVFGRAPAHALFIGFFGSLLVAMVTRVTQGHSGRLLELGRVGGFAFLTIQLVTVLRIVAELRPDPALWQVIAAAGWLLAFLPWVLRSSWIYLTPRTDARAG